MPARKAAHLKAIAGTARPDRGAKADPAARLVEAPKPPAHLSERAAVEWHRLAPAAVGLGTLSAADLRAFELLAETLATAEEARLTVAAEGYSTGTADGGRKPHPAVRVMETARAQAARLLDAFGLTPRGRQGVDPAPLPKADNPFARLGHAGREGQQSDPWDTLTG